MCIRDRGAGVAADRPAGARTDVDQVVGRAGRGAFRQVQAEAQILKQAGFEPHEDRRPDRRHFERRHQRLERQKDAGMRLTLRQRALGHARRRRQPGQRQGVVEQGAGPLAYRLQSYRAEVIRGCLLYTSPSPRDS